MNANTRFWMRYLPGVERDTGKQQAVCGIWMAPLVAACLVGCSASDEIAGPGSPLYATAVQSSIEEQNKGAAVGEAGQNAATSAVVRKVSQKDVSLMESVRRERAAVVATGGVQTVCIYWTEDSGEFRRDPPGGGKGDQEYYVFWSGEQKRFLQVPVALSAGHRARVPKGWGVVLSGRDRNIYVYWCDVCKKAHKQLWQLQDTPEPAAIAISELATPEAAH